MATGFPFSDRRKRPSLTGAAVAPSHQGPAAAGPDAAGTAPSPHRIEPTRASVRGRSYVDIATVPGGYSLPHRDVLG